MPHSSSVCHTFSTPGWRGKLYKRDILTDYLQNIKETVEYKRWFFGYMHINYDMPYERVICLYENIIQIQ